MQPGKSASWIGAGLIVVLGAALLVARVWPPRIHYVPAYEGMALYAAGARDADATTRAQLYEKHVGAPYRARCSGEGEQYATSRSRLETPIADLEGLSRALAQIGSRPVEPRITDALRNALRHLPMREVTVCVSAFPPELPLVSLVRERMRGIYGFNEVPGVIWLEIAPAEGWFEQLPYGTAHEFAHAAARTSGVLSLPLLDAMLDEGRADAFATLLYPEQAPFWTHALTPAQESTVWQAMQPHLESTDPAVVDAYLFGTGDDRVPLVAGYTIGFSIASSYLRLHPGEPPSAWLDVDADTFLGKSRYHGIAQPGD